MMQGAVTAVGFSAVLPVKGSPAPRSAAMARVPAAGRTLPGRARAAAVTPEPVEVDYSSNISFVAQLLNSVFPMEACDLTGGEACNAQMYPEAKLAASAASARPAAEDVEREYLAYDEPKTVFPGEACDDLGGEFCEAPYQTGVSRDA